ncbi:MAG: hypothetical protein Q9218_002038 [Villophora microphyllina]
MASRSERIQRHFEIRLQQSTLVLRGNAEEASSVHLQGTLVLFLTEPLKVQSLRLRLTGEKRVSWGAGGPSTRKEEAFLRIPWEFVNLGPRRGDTLAAGKHEWPFDHVLPGYTPESIEGMSESYLIYRLKATIDRGILSQNVIARKHVRVIRTLDAAALELSQEVAIGNNWEDKINYSITTPNKGVVFGTAVPINFRIASLLKGLRIGEIHTELAEIHHFQIGPRGQLMTPRNHRPVKEVYVFPQDQATELVDGMDCWVFTRQLSLPKTLRECRQSVTALGFRIEHRLEITVKLVNPDAHISRVYAHIPLFIYISPYLPIDENNDMVLPDSGVVDPNDYAVGPPPVYGEHRFDTLFNGMEPSGYLTPAGQLSGANTPFNSQSRRGSADDLASLVGTTRTAVNLSTLQGRLSNLSNTRESHTDQPRRPISACHSDAPPGPGQDGSEESHVDWQDRETVDQTSLPAQHFEYDPAELARVPSYATALRSHPQTPTNEVPPAYEVVDRQDR